MCTFKRINKLQNFLENIDLFSDTRDTIIIALFSYCVPIQLDSKNIGFLPRRLTNVVKFDKKVFFVGKGLTFEVWDKEKFNIYYKKSRQIAKKFIFILKTKEVE